jgi:hypothetical protein
MIRMLMALPVLPHEIIPEAFRQLQEEAEGELMNCLFAYFDQTWMGGRWKPEEWSVYRRSIRTNNDVEGWHRRLNTKAARGGSYYSSLRE